MRRARGGGFLFENNELVGLNLGADFVAEHEFGYAPLASYFGLDGTKLGLEKFGCSLFPEPTVAMGMIYQKKSMILIVDAYQQAKYEAELKNGANAKLLAAMCGVSPFSQESFVAAWDDHSFAVLVRGKENIQYLQEILKAWRNHSLCLMIQRKKNPFSNPGLSLVIPDMVSEEEKAKMIEEDKNAIALGKAAARTKIDKILERAGRKYYALVPQWTNFFQSPQYQTKYPVIFFLNPCEQRLYNFGWFTVENLKDWAKGTGPVVKS